ncbi:MAG: hypothetical protein ACLGJB_27130 [Blastocatellia bacterium]
MSDVVDGFPRLRITKKTGSEHFHRGGHPLEPTLLEFWQWFASDLTNNVLRGVLAEYIVAKALGIADGLRESWSPYDLITPSGIKIEVKSAAYLQSWFHKKLSIISFGIGPTRGYDADTNKLADEIKRQADVYVFCLLKQKDKDTLDPLDLNQWEFYILAASVLNERCPTRNSIGLARLQKLNPCKARFEEIAECVEMLTRSIKAAI